VVYEPKRAYLGESRPKDVVTALMNFQKDTGIPLRLALPTVVRSWDEGPLKAIVEEYMSMSPSSSSSSPPRFEVTNLGGLTMLEAWSCHVGRPSYEWSTDFTLYSLNSQATAAWVEQGASLITLSVEDDAHNIRDHLFRWPVLPSFARPQVILYQVRRRRRKRSDNNI